MRTFDIEDGIPVPKVAGRGPRGGLAADLRRAYLRSGELRIIHGPMRSDGYDFSLRVCILGFHEVAAGCRRMTIEGYREHVAREYPNTPKAAETLAILDYLEARRDQIFAEWRGN